MVDVIGTLIARVLLTLFAGLMLMVCLGAAHDFDEVVPDLSFGASFFLALGIHIATDMKLDDD